MNTDELQSFIDTHSCLREYVRGVYAINTLPTYVTIYPSAFIVNTDPIPNPGKHWVLVIFHSPWKADYFDSFGRKPSYSGLGGFISKNSSSVHYVENQLQSKTSDYCGLYVLFVLIMILCKHISLDCIYSFFTNDVINNDHFVHNFISEYI